MDKQSILCRTFRDLHERGCFILPNPWDIGSARVLEQLGFKALATTSAGFAWSMGHADDQVSVEMTLDHVGFPSPGRWAESREGGGYAAAAVS